MDPHELKSAMAAAARQAGFDLFGVTSPEAPSRARELDDWILHGRAGGLDYIVRRRVELLNPGMLMPGLRSILSFALSYRPEDELWPLVGRHRIACYAWGWDYHWVVMDKLKKVAARLAELAPGARSRCFVDAGPVLEKSHAHHAGLGFPGKNTLLLNRGHGSMLFLGEILTDAELALDEPERMDPCGTCRRCLDACPTGALVAPRILDAARCISYRTQREDPLPREEDALHGMVWGCDLCQKACPYNEKAPPGREEALSARGEILGLSAEWIATVPEKELAHRIRATPLAHAGTGILRRNASYIIERRTPPDRVS